MTFYDLSPQESFNYVESVFPDVDEQWLKALMTSMLEQRGPRHLCQHVLDYIFSLPKYPKVKTRAAAATSPSGNENKKTDVHSKKSVQEVVMDESRDSALTKKAAEPKKTKRTCSVSELVAFTKRIKLVDPVVIMDLSDNEEDSCSESSFCDVNTNEQSGSERLSTNCSSQSTKERTVLKPRRRQTGRYSGTQCDADDELTGHSSDDDVGAAHSSRINQSPVERGSGMDYTETIRVCNSCNASFSPDKLVVCTDGHLTCSKCMDDTVKKTLKSQGKQVNRRGPHHSASHFSVNCPLTDCCDWIPLDQLRKILKPAIFEVIEESMIENSLTELEKTQGVVICPGCYIKVRLDSGEKVLNCSNCGQSTCRYCKEEYLEGYGVDHSQCEGSSDMPRHWVTKDPLDQMKGFVKITLDGASQEYKEVAAKYYETMSATIVSIERVENPHLWRCYSLHKNFVQEKNGKSALNEMQLFHGTKSDLVSTICEQNLDFRLSGSANGAAFGLD